MTDYTDSITPTCNTIFSQYFSEYSKIPYDINKHIYIYGSSTYYGVTLFNTRSLSRNNRHNIRRLDDINIRQLLNLKYLIVISNKNITLCLEKNIVFFKNNDNQICVGFVINSNYGEIEIPVIGMDNIRLRRILNNGILNSLIFKKIRNNKRFVAYITLVKLSKFDSFLVKNLVNNYL